MCVCVCVFVDIQMYIRIIVGTMECRGSCHNSYIGIHPILLYTHAWPMLFLEQ